MRPENFVVDERRETEGPRKILNSQYETSFFLSRLGLNHFWLKVR